MLSFTGWQLLFGGIFLLPIALWVEGVPSQLTTINYIGYGYLSVFGALLATTCGLEASINCLRLVSLSLAFSVQFQRVYLDISS